MPRNGAGVYSRPVNSWNPIVPGSIANGAPDGNATLDDMTAALSASIANDGQTTTTARIPFAQGTSAVGTLPGSLAYANFNQPTTGFYFPAALGTIGAAVAGVNAWLTNQGGFGLNFNPTVAAGERYYFANELTQTGYLSYVNGVQAGGFTANATAVTFGASGAQTVYFNTGGLGAGSRRIMLSATALSPVTDNTTDLGTTAIRYRAAYAVRLLPEDGTAALPSYGFRTDLDTGAYLQAANVYGVSTAGVGRTRTSSSGFEPETDNSLPLGSASRRWTVVFAVAGAINTSDARQKSQIKDSDLGLNFVNALQARSFKMNGDTSGKRHFGLIAQEVKATLDQAGASDAAFYHEGETLGLNYSGLIAPLIKAVQELSRRVVELEGKINAAS